MLQSNNNNRGSRGKKNKQSEPKFLGLRKGIAKGISFIHGDAHFIFKSAADITARSEAFFVNKLCKDQNVEDIIEDRHNKTESKQDAIINAPAKMREFFQNTMSFHEEETVFHTSSEV